MSSEDLIPKLVEVVDQLKAQGMSWWSSEETARIAIRRWYSFGRRYPKAKRVTFEMHVEDLAKGLQNHFEPDIPFSPKSDFLYVAKPLAQVLELG